MLRVRGLVEGKEDAGVVEGFADQVTPGGGDVGVGFAEDLLVVLCCVRWRIFYARSRDRKLDG